MTQHIPPLGANLTPYESKVFKYVSMGLSNTEIAVIMPKTTQSISIAIWRIKCKLGIERDLRLALLAEHWDRLHTEGLGK